LEKSWRTLIRRRPVISWSPFTCRTTRCYRVSYLCTVSYRIVSCRIGVEDAGCEASNAAITIAVRLRYDYDPTTTYRARLLPLHAVRREQKMNMSIFRRSRIVVESQL